MLQFLICKFIQKYVKKRPFVPKPHSEICCWIAFGFSPPTGPTQAL